MKTFSKLALSVLILMIAACATKPVDYQSGDAEPVRQWQSKTLLIDKLKSKSHNLSVDFVADRKERLRMDVMGTFATPVAAMVLDNGNMTYILPQQKKFFQGEAKGNTLASVLKVGIEPKVIYNLLYDEPIVGWTCRKLPSGLIAGCESPADKVKVDWIERTGTSRKIRITNVHYEITMTLNRVPTKVQQPDRVFTLNIPSGYKNETL